MEVTQAVSRVEGGRNWPEIVVLSSDSASLFNAISRSDDVQRLPRPFDGRRRGVVLVVPLSGEIVVEDEERRTSLGVQDYLITGSERLKAVELAPRASVALFWRAGLEARSGVDRSRPLVGGPAVDPAARLLAAMVRSAAVAAVTLEPELFDKLAEVFARLLALSQGNPMARPRLSRRTGASTLAAVKAWMLENLGVATMSPRTAALQAGISLRYLHLLFRQEGTTFSHWLWQQRLEACKRKIVATEYARISIGEIAAESGFSSFSHFSRRFRKAFGISATELRGQVFQAVPGPATASDETPSDSPPQ